MQMLAKDSKTDAIVIAGPTASGKSALAMDIAKAHRGVVINADSMQVYAELRILTNRPSTEDEASVPHRLYGFRPASQPYSVGLWLAAVSVALEEANASGLLPIIVGGTGLYLKALTEGLSDIPDIPANVREQTRRRASEDGPEALYRDLAEVDPKTASRLQPADTQRIVRALEVWIATGKALSEWQYTRAPPLLPLSRALCMVVEAPREELYARCNARFDAMIEAGGLEEARRLLALELSPTLPLMRAVGLRPLLEFLQGRISLAQAIGAGKADTRHYAKRQDTWIRSNFNSWNRYAVQLMERIKRNNILLPHDA